MVYLLEGTLSKWRYKKIPEFIKNKRVILEIGCGAKASFLRFLAKDKNKKIIGFDHKIDENLPRPKNLLLKKEKIIDKINLADDSVDCVIMLAVLEHLDYPQEIISEIRRILKPGGLMCLTVPTFLAKSIIKLMAFLRLLNPSLVAEHKNYFNKEILEKMARQGCFKRTEHRYFQLSCNNFFIAYKI